MSTMSLFFASVRLPPIPVVPPAFVGPDMTGRRPDVNSGASA